MDVVKIINIQEYALRNTSREELVSMVLFLRKELMEQRDTSDAKIFILQEKLTKKEVELSKLTKESINKAANQPSSKQPEFSKNTGAGKKKSTKKKRRAGRKGAGNRSKSTADTTNINFLACCPNCQSDLTLQPVIGVTSRIVEDIPPIPEKTILTEEIQERKWCSVCLKIVSSSSEAALPQSDIGLRALGLIAYLWVISAISLPGIAAFLNSFFRLCLSTAGLSKMMIRVAKIMEPVYEEILNDVKGGMIIFADETGWRVKGILWWLWIFANKRSAYYWPDKLRGSIVVEKVLGNVFSGVLVTDAWYAYMKIICAKQTCMAHILRKIRKFRDAYPAYYSIVLFYRKLRRILIDGERLQLMRKDVDEEVFLRRLCLLKTRLKKLLAWKNPNDVLKNIIAKVDRQQEYILTFVEHDGVPNHNNYGEYIIKKSVLKRKVSGGSMSEDGLRAYTVLQSIAQTCHLRKLAFTDFLAVSLTSYIRDGKPFLLSQYEMRQLSAGVDRKAA